MSLCYGSILDSFLTEMSDYIIVINGVEREVTRRQFKLHYRLEELYRSRTFFTNWLAELNKRRPFETEEEIKKYEEIEEYFIDAEDKLYLLWHTLYPEYRDRKPQGRTDILG